MKKKKIINRYPWGKGGEMTHTYAHMNKKNNKTIIHTSKPTG
jgi:hypothetical protein